jgi:hypothetical protein
MSPAAALRSHVFCTYFVLVAVIIVLAGGVIAFLQ